MAFAKQKTVIVYKIHFHGHPDDSYIGSTTTGMKKRLAVHKRYYKTGKDKALYNFARANGGWDLALHDIIHSTEVNNKREQNACEQRFIAELSPTLNGRHTAPEEIAVESKEENAVESKEEITDDREHALKNKDRIKTYQRKRYEDPKHRALAIARAKEHYNQRKMMPVKCACGLTVNTRGKPLTQASIKAFQRKNCKCNNHILVRNSEPEPALVAVA